MLLHILRGTRRTSQSTRRKEEEEGKKGEERKKGEGGAENEKGRSQKREGRRRRQKDHTDEGRGEKDHMFLSGSTVNQQNQLIRPHVSVVFSSSPEHFCSLML